MDDNEYDDFDGTEEDDPDLPSEADGLTEGDLGYATGAHDVDNELGNPDPLEAAPAGALEELLQYKAKRKVKRDRDDLHDQITEMGVTDRESD